MRPSVVLLHRGPASARRPLASAASCRSRTPASGSRASGLRTCTQCGATTPPPSPGPNGEKRAPRTPRRAEGPRGPMIAVIRRLRSVAGGGLRPRRRHARRDGVLPAGRNGDELGAEASGARSSDSPGGTRVRGGSHVLQVRSPEDDGEARRDDARPGVRSRWHPPASATHAGLVRAWGRAEGEHRRVLAAPFLGGDAHRVDGDQDGEQERDHLRDAQDREELVHVAAHRVRRRPIPARRRRRRGSRRGRA